MLKNCNKTASNRLSGRNLRHFFNITQIFDLKFHHFPLITICGTFCFIAPEILLFEPVSMIKMQMGKHFHNIL